MDENGVQNKKCRMAEWREKECVSHPVCLLSHPTAKAKDRTPRGTNHSHRKKTERTDNDRWTLIFDHTWKFRNTLFLEHTGEDPFFLDQSHSDKRSLLVLVSHIPLILSLNNLFRRIQPKRELRSWTPQKWSTGKRLYWVQTQSTEECLEISPLPSWDHSYLAVGRD